MIHWFSSFLNWALNQTLKSDQVLEWPLLKHAKNMPVAPVGHLFPFPQVGCDVDVTLHHFSTAVSALVGEWWFAMENRLTSNHKTHGNGTGRLDDWLRNRKSLIAVAWLLGSRTLGCTSHFREVVFVG